MSCAGFFGMLSYPFTRTSATPYFNTAYGSENLPWAMAAAAGLSLIVILIYNDLVKKIPLLWITIGSTALIIVVNSAFGLSMGAHPRWMALLYYAWSDVYVMLIVEQFWSISNTIFDRHSAKNLYGVFLGAGALGGLAGNALVIRLATDVGSGNLIFFCGVALLLFLLFIALLKGEIAGNEISRQKMLVEHEVADRSYLGGLTLVLKSRYLMLITMLVVAIQLYINALYFAYNLKLDEAIKTVDTQSAAYAKIFFIIQLLTIFCAFVLTPLALRLLGITRTHYSIFGIIFAMFIAVLISPKLIIFAAIFVVAKSFDYSVFRAAKEILLVPLTTAEKFQAKGFIDIFMYRFSKAIAAFGIIAITGWLNIRLSYMIGFGIALWFIAITLILRIYRSQFSVRST